MTSERILNLAVQLCVDQPLISDLWITHFCCDITAVVLELSLMDKTRIN